VRPCRMRSRAPLVLLSGLIHSHSAARSTSSLEPVRL